MDPLSEALSLLQPLVYVGGGLDAGGRWSIRFPEGRLDRENLRCYAVVSGECWLIMEDASEQLCLTAGDAVLVSGATPFRLASDAETPAADLLDLISRPLNGGVITYNGGGDFFGVGAYFSFEKDHAGILMNLLPVVLFIQDEAGRVAIRWALEQMTQELNKPRPGGFLIVQHLAHLLLVQALRLHFTEGRATGPNWLSALADRQMAMAIGAMHNDPTHRWTLQSLANLTGMSRSSFAVKFKQTVGVPAMDYLVRWKMLLAAERVANEKGSIAEIAHSLGYDSVSAFSAAFRRTMNCSPREYGQLRKT